MCGNKNRDGEKRSKDVRSNAYKKEVSTPVVKLMLSASFCETRNCKTREIVYPGLGDVIG